MQTALYLDKKELVQTFTKSPTSLEPQALRKIWEQPIFPVNIWFDETKNKWVKQGLTGWNTPSGDKSCLDKPAYGVLLGNDLVVLDIDNHGVSGDAHYRRWLDTRGHAHRDTFTVATPTGGTHYYYLSSKARDRITFPEYGIDLIAGNGKFIVGPLSKYQNGTYEITDESEIAEYPDFLDELFSDLTPLAAQKSVPTRSSWTGNQQSGIPLELREPLEKARNAGAFSSRDDWLKLGFAINARGGTLQDWISLSDGTPAAEVGCKEAWNSMKSDGGITGGTLYHYAEPFRRGYPSQSSGSQPTEGSVEWFEQNFVKLQVAKSIEFYRKGTDVETALPLEAFCLKYSNYCFEQDIDTSGLKGKKRTKTISVDPARIFSKQARTAEFRFVPGGKEFFTEDGELCFNAFLGFPHQNKPENDGKTKVILDFIREVVANDDDDSSEFMLDMMAHKLQHPLKKLGIITALQSNSHGVGKGQFFRILSELSNPRHSISNATMASLHGHFNGEYKTKLWCFINEAVMGMEDAEVLKGLTDQVWRYEDKGKAAFSAPNYTDFVIATNLEWSAPVEGADRRYFSLALNEKYSDDESYYRILNDAIENGGLPGLDTFLRERKIRTNFGSNNCIPDTKAKAKNFWCGVPEVVKWFVKWQHGQLSDCTNHTVQEVPVTRMTNREFDDLLRKYFPGKSSGASMSPLKKELAKHFPRAYKKSHTAKERGLVFSEDDILRDLQCTRAGKLLTLDDILE